MSRSLHLFYQDLRLNDNPALYAASSSNSLFLLYVYPKDLGFMEAGGASKAWLGHSLEKLQLSLKHKGLQLHFDQGPWVKTVLAHLKKQKITDLYFNIPIDGNFLDVNGLQKACRAAEIGFHGYFSTVLFHPDTILNQSQKPYQVFTPFAKTCLKQELDFKILGIPKTWPKGLKGGGCTLKSLKLLPKIHWDHDFYQFFKVGEEGALKALKDFEKNKAAHYGHDRDIPALEGTSKLSPHLHFGEISIRKVWKNAKGSFRNELLWREFAHHLLFHFPKTPFFSLKESFKDFPWRKNAGLLKKWQNGLTGIPIVDAGMRQLWKTGWMHNRVRMIVASFLVKDLMIPWQEGAKWFWDTLVDADVANNTLGWQWVAGCGADAAPFFRIFNPYLQGEKFDPDGEYVKRYLPELQKLDSRYIHRPHEAPLEVLKKAGIELGKTYPYPMIDHEIAKKKTLLLYKGWKR